MQGFGLELLMFSDNIRAGWDREEELRLALIASGKFDFAADALAGLLPVESTGEVATDAAGDALEDYSAVEWQSPTTMGEEGVMSDLAKFQEAMAANATISVGDDEEGEWL